ncbi:hypothetical protein [Nocardia sp. NPDC047654]|uniref:hypothetical protein n=1 Tax=Nocardia sp. NPDC047654 TaxID=3364314 RepID=UPI0037121E80
MSANENGPRSAAQTGGQEGGDPERSDAESTAEDRAAEYVHGLQAAAVLGELRGGEDLAGADPREILDALSMGTLARSYGVLGAVPEHFDEAEWFPVSALAMIAPEFRPTREDVAKWCADNGVSDPHTARDEVARRWAETMVGGAGRAEMYLPLEFWERRGFLRHIQQAAWARDESPHGVLLAVLALLSAHVDPSVRIETGIKSPLPLNLYAGLVSTSGEGKSSATTAATRLLSVTYPDPLGPGCIAGDEVPRTHNLGTGQGVAEMYMGTVKVADPVTGKFESVRQQVRHKVMFDVDEAGEMLAGMQLRGSTLSSVLRSAWSGNMRGQANASRETYREVTDFTIGLVAGFQREVLARLLTDVECENGTPQRFLFGPVVDPFVPEIEDTPADPGPLRVGPLPVGELRVCSELARAIKVESLKRRRGQLSLTQLESQRPAMLARVAALLVILDGRTVVEAEDWELARSLFACSLAVQSDASEWERDREAERAGERMAAAATLAVVQAAAVDDREATLARLQKRILDNLRPVGVPTAWKGDKGIKRTKFRGPLRALAESALEALVNAGQVAFDGESVTRL